MPAIAGAFLAGAAVAGGLGLLFGGFTDDVAKLVKWGAIGGGVYVAGKYLKVL